MRHTRTGLAVLLALLIAEAASADFLVLANGKSFGGELTLHPDGSAETSKTKFRYPRKAYARASKEKTVEALIGKWSGELGESRAPVVREGYLALAKFCMAQKRYDDANRFFERTGPTRAWCVFSSKNYFILSDTKEKRVREVRDRLDAIVAFYYRQIGQEREPGRDFVVRFFKTEAAFDAFAAKVGLSNAGAFYSPRLGELVLWDASMTNKKATFESVYHEASHQVVEDYLDHSPQHGWFDEGLATYYESAKYRSGRIVDCGKKNQDYAATLKQAIRAGQLVPWRTFLAMDYDGFYCGGDKESVHYAQAWGLVYFLKTTRDKKCRAFLAAYVAALRETKDDAKALAKAIAVLGVDELERRFRAFEKRF